jgi:hypothetical protein
LVDRSNFSGRADSAHAGAAISKAAQMNKVFRMPRF